VLLQFFIGRGLQNILEAINKKVNIKEVSKSVPFWTILVWQSSPKVQPFSSGCKLFYNN
jgi:hypothetical protein